MKKKTEFPKDVLEFFRTTGKIGGKTRAANMSAEERTEQARKAVQARWAKAKVSATKKSTKGTK